MKLALRHILTLMMVQALFFSCLKDYSFEGNRSAGWLLKDANQNCNLITVTGSYIVGRSLGANNYLDVQVHVTRTGTFSISTRTINGYSFSASGNFADTGIVHLKLPGAGKPLLPGTNIITVSYDSSQCEASVQVLDSLSNIVQASNPDHFPLADNNHWSYDDLSYPGDSVIRTINGSGIQMGTQHFNEDYYISFYPATNQNYYRKNGDNYYEYVAVSTFTSALDYAPSIYDDINFLKENCQSGENWYSNTYSGRTSLGLQVLALRYHFHCIDADATVVLNGKTFLHVYKVQMIPEVGDVGAPLVATGEIHTAYYAKGVGLIYAEFFNSIMTHAELRIRSWLVH